MPLDFPNNPVVGQTYQPSGQPQVYTWSGEKWSVKYNAQTASNAQFAQTASYVTILGDGITVNYSQLGIELTGSGGGGSQNLDGVLSVGHTTSGSITMGEYPYWPTNWAATASLAIGSGSLSLTSHSIALGLNSVAGNPNSIAIGNGSVTGRYLYDDGSILGIDQSQVRWTGLGLPTPPVDWFKVGKSYIAFGDEIALTEADIRKAIIINNVTSVQSDMLGRLTVNHSGLTGNNINAINSTKPRIWIEIDSAPYSFAQGEGVFSAGASQHVIGQYNSELSDEGALIVGNGSDDANRSNLLVASGNTVQITGSLWVNGNEITGGGSEPSLLISSSGESQDPFTAGQPVSMSMDYRSGSLRASVTVNPDGFGGAGEANVYTLGIGSDSMFLTNQHESYGQTTNGNIISKRDGSLELTSNFLNIQRSELVVSPSSATIYSIDGFTGMSSAIGVGAETATIDANIVLLPATVIHNYPNDTDAATAGIPLGGVYHHNGVLRIRHT